ncbi:MAG: hypothetical protein ABI968_12200 [Acidobacteriota bacterium]
MSRRGTLAAVAACVCFAPSLAAQTPKPSAWPPAARPPSSAKSHRPPLDFTGVWELDAKESKNAAPQMAKAVLSVKQNGDRIWIEALDGSAPRVLSEEIVVDGRTYEKRLGPDKGTLVAKWGKDDASLWLEAQIGTSKDGRSGLQRMVWRLRDFGNTWTRQTWTIQGKSVKETYLIFHKRVAGKGPTPKTTPAPKAATPGH